MNRHLQNVLDALHRRTKYVVSVILVDPNTQTVFAVSVGIN